jgi:hypothetical protein
MKGNGEVANAGERSLIEAAKLVLRGGEAEFWVKGAGSSMEPLLRAGCDLGVRTNQKVSIGHVVVAVCDHELVSHRVVARMGPTERPVFVTKGDALQSYDRFPVRPENVLGIVEVVHDNGHTRRLDTPAALWAAQAMARLSWWQGRASRRLQHHPSLVSLKSLAAVIIRSAAAICFSLVGRMARRL